MTIQQITTGVESLTPAVEVDIYSPVVAGGAVLLLNLSDMAATDELVVRHKVTFPAGPLVVTVGSKTIEHGVTTDDTWNTTAGAADADGWESWPLGFGDDGGTVSLESVSGSYDIEYIVLDLSGPTG